MTFCTKNHDLYFGDVIDGRMKLSEIGEYSLHCIEKIPEINDNVAVPEFVVMPNHVHMIVIIDNPIEWPDDKRLSQYDQRLPQCDSPTNPMGNDNPDGGFVGCRITTAAIFSTHLCSVLVGNSINAPCNMMNEHADRRNHYPLVPTSLSWSRREISQAKILFIVVLWRSQNTSLSIKPLFL